MLDEVDDEPAESDDASLEFDVSVVSLVAGFLDVVEDELEAEDDPPDEEDAVG